MLKLYVIKRIYISFVSFKTWHNFHIKLIVGTVVDLRGGGSRWSGPLPDSEFRLCIVFSSKFENIQNINIQYEKFNGPPPKKNFQNPPLARYTV